MVEDACQRIYVFDSAFLTIGFDDGAADGELLFLEDAHDLSLHEILRFALEACLFIRELFDDNIGDWTTYALL